MGNADDRDSKRVRNCSLCGKSQHDVSDFAGGPADVYEFICNECIDAEVAKAKNPTLVF
jgi:ATP-dependent protease Clp ATPase subunit